MARLQFSKFILRHAADPLSTVRLFRAARQRSFGSDPEKIFEIRLRFDGRIVRLAIRSHTTDIGSLAEVFSQNIYDLPTAFDPEVIIDAGANVGMASIFFGVRFPNARICAFEPVPANFALLRRNIEANSLTNVECYEVGLSDRDEQVMMVPSRAGVFWSFSAQRIGNAGGGVEARFRNADAVVSELGISGISVLKLDVEGSELRVLQALSPILPRTDFIVGEIHTNYVAPVDALGLLARTHLVDFRKPIWGGEAFAFRASRRNGPSEPIGSAR